MQSEPDHAARLSQFCILATSDSTLQFGKRTACSDGGLHGSLLASLSFFLLPDTRSIALAHSIPGMAAASLRVQSFRAVASPIRAPASRRSSVTVFARKIAAKTAYICIDCECCSLWPSCRVEQLFLKLMRIIECLHHPDPQLWQPSVIHSWTATAAGRPTCCQTMAWFLGPGSLPNRSQLATPQLVISRKTGCAQ